MTTLSFDFFFKDNVFFKVEEREKIRRKKNIVVTSLCRGMRHTPHHYGVWPPRNIAHDSHLNARAINFLFK